IRFVRLFGMEEDALKTSAPGWGEEQPIVFAQRRKPPPIRFPQPVDQGVDGTLVFASIKKPPLSTALLAAAASTKQSVQPLPPDKIVPKRPEASPAAL